MLKCQDPKNAQKHIERITVQLRFRQMYPDKAKALSGYTIPPYETVQELVEYANEKIKNQNYILEQKKKLRASMEAPVKFDKFGKYKY